MRALPSALRPLVRLVRRYALVCPVEARYSRPRKGATKAGARLSGQCDNAASMFRWLAGGPALGWRLRNLPARLWRLGPHWFIEHAPTGTIVDPTADQYPSGTRIPYERAEGRSSGGERRDPRTGEMLPKRSALLGAKALLEDPGARAIITLARRWAGANT